MRTARTERAAAILALATAVALVGTGCSGVGPKDPAGPTDPDGAQDEAPADRTVADDAGGAQVTGLLGTIAQHEVEEVMRRKQQKILDCFAAAYEVLEEIEGSIELSFEVTADGRARDVYLSGGDLGSKAAADCIVDAVGRFGFPRPRGGDHAVVSYPMTFEAPYDRPVPLNWGSATASDILGAHADDLERCLGGETGFTLALYVVKGGKVASAGATSSSFAHRDRAACLADAAMTWLFPDPGERPAKAVLEL